MRTRTLSGSDADLELAAEALRNGGLVAVPTETVYGLAAKALDERAVAKIFEAKERPLFDPLILHLPQAWRADPFGHGIIDREALSQEARERVMRLTEAFWPGPLTIVLPKTPAVPDIVTSGLDTVAVRVPDHPITQRLLALVGFPLAAPSANRFGRISPTSAPDVLEELEGRIDFVIDGGACEIGIESTVVRVVDGETIQLLRPGRIEREMIEEVSGVRVVEPEPQTDEHHSPGRLESHYSPAKPLFLFDPADPDSVHRLADRGALGVLFFSDETAERIRDRLNAELFAASRVLSPSGDSIVAGRNLFRMLRELDASDATVILAELPPGESGISHAIADRLRRAALKDE